MASPYGVLDVSGPTLEFLILPEEADRAYCAMRDPSALKRVLLNGSQQTGAFDRIGLWLHDLTRLATLQAMRKHHNEPTTRHRQGLSPETEFNVVDSVLPQRRDVPRIDANS
jgi:hypothetical protein